MKGSCRSTVFAFGGRAEVNSSTSLLLVFYVSAYIQCFDDMQ